MTSSSGTSWGIPTNTYKLLNAICWAPEIGQAIAMANDASTPVFTYNNVSGWTLRTSGSIASINWTCNAWSPILGIAVGLSNSGSSRGCYSTNLNSININRNGNAITRNGMLASIGPT